MDVNTILQADVLDILFEGKNKEYGAYQLRRTYNRRLGKALLSMSVILLLLLIGYYASSMGGTKMVRPVDVKDVVLDRVEEKKELPPPPPPPPPRTIPPPVATRIFTPPLLVKEDVKETEKPPTQETLEDVKIGTVNKDGTKDEGFAAPPPSDAGHGVVEAPKKDETDYEQTFTKVEIPAAYPGGMAAWLRYLNRNLRTPEDAISNEIQGTVVVQFTVDKDGNVADVVAISGPEQGGLREEAVRVIAKSGKWIPAVQNGRHVKAYHNQPIIFKLEGQ